MILEDNPFGVSLLNDLVARNLPLVEFTAEAEKRGVHVVQPDEITTCEMRMDFKRFYPDVNDNDIVIGGDFH